MTNFLKRVVLAFKTVVFSPPLRLIDNVDKCIVVFIQEMKVIENCSRKLEKWSCMGGSRVSTRGIGCHFKKIKSNPKVAVFCSLPKC